MSTEPEVAPVSRKLFWAGCVVSALPVLLLVMSATMKLRNAPEVAEGMEKFGYPGGVAFALGIVELASVVLYVFPRTAVLGAILLTGYLGGATATHVRVSDPFFAPIVVGVLVWLGLLLRERRLWPLLPWRT